MWVQVTQDKARGRDLWTDKLRVAWNLEFLQQLIKKLILFIPHISFFVFIVRWIYIHRKINIIKQGLMK